MDGAFVSNTWQMTLTGQDLPEAVPTQYFSANGLNALGVPPLLERVFNEADGPAGEQGHYFATMRIPLIQGCVWSDSESAGRPTWPSTKRWLVSCGLTNPRLAGVGLNTVVAQWSIGNLNDPVVLVAVSLVLLVVTMMSAAIPANRAASIQPADALRID